MEPAADSEPLPVAVGLGVDRALDPHLARDPEAFECPVSACEYDCQKRAPVRLACACKRLVCRKCADNAGTQPWGCVMCCSMAASAKPGPSCWFSSSAGHHRPAGPTRDVGALLALAATSKVPTRSVSCVDCARDGVSEPATWECHEAKCDLKALCDAHIMLHRKWGHPVGVLTAEGGPPSDAMLGATHCPKPEHVGSEGALTHYCTHCKVLVCIRCGMDDHIREHHAVEPVDAAAAAAAPGTKASLDAAAVAHTRLSSSTAELRGAIQELQANLTSAEAAVETNYSRVLTQLHAAKHSLLSQLHSTYSSKLDTLTKSLILARGAVGELATLCSAGKIAVASSSPVLQLHVAHTLAASKGAMELPSPVVTDTTLEVLVDATKPVFPLGTVNSHALDLDRCSLKWRVSLSGGPVPTVTPGTPLVAELRLFRCDGSPADVSPARVSASASGIAGEAAVSVGGFGLGLGLGAGRGHRDGAGAGSSVAGVAHSGPGVTVTQASRGVFHLSATVPASVREDTTFFLRAVVSGVGVVGKPLAAAVRLLLFDPAAGGSRNISSDGKTLTFEGDASGQCFRGRTCLLHASSGVALDLGVEMRGRGGSFTVALGGADRIAEKSDFSTGSNRGLSFFLDLHNGVVNSEQLPPGRSSGHSVMVPVGGPSMFREAASHAASGRPSLRLQSTGVRVLHFRVRGTTLTFRCGDSTETLEDQPGSWSLPAEFYVLFAGLKAGSSVRLFSLA
jgi:hypothetical protein